LTRWSSIRWFDPPESGRYIQQMARLTPKEQTQAVELIRRQKERLEQQSEEIEALKKEVAVLRAGFSEASGLDAYSFVQSVFRDPEVPLSLRLQAAKEALKVEQPRVQGFVLYDALEAARLAKRKAPMIEAKLTPDPAA
jgi:hypothetical protein